MQRDRTLRGRGRVWVAAACMLTVLGATTARADVERIREKALELEQKLNRHRFQVDTRGEDANTLRIYKDFTFLLKPSKVKEAAKAASDPNSDRLRLYLVERIAGLELASYRDDLARYLAEATAEVDGEAQNYTSLLTRLATSSDDVERRKVYTSLRSLVETADVFRNQILQRTAKAYAAQGYESFAAFYAEREGVDLARVVSLADSFLTATEALYDSLFAEQAKNLLGMEARKVRFGDLPFLASGAAFAEAFPSGKRPGRTRSLFRGLGVDLDALSNLTWDTKPRPRRQVGGGVYPIVVPADVAAGFRPIGVPADDDAAAFLLAEAMSFAMSRQTGFEPAYLARQAPLAALGYLVRSVRDEPGWLQESTGLEGPDLDAYRRYRAFVLLLEARRLAAQVLFETEIYGSAPADAGRSFREHMKRALGVRLSSSDAARALGYAQGLASVGRFQGLLWAESLRAHLRSTVGEDWYRDGKAASVLAGWWGAGAALDAEHLQSDAGDLDHHGVDRFLQRVRALAGTNR